MGQEQNQEEKEDIRSIFPEIKNSSIRSYERIRENLYKKDRIDQAGIIDLVRKEKNINLEERLFIATKLAVEMAELKNVVGKQKKSENKSN